MTFFSKIFAASTQANTFSQEGEDLILDELFGACPIGYFVDVGAYDPWKFSNTANFYKRGWSGINIDPRPGFKRRFDKLRPRDLNLEYAVGLKTKSQNFYEFDEPALNTLSRKRAKYICKHTKYKLLNTRLVQVLPLKKILRDFCMQKIDLLNVDVEGEELAVLRSGDWKRFRPRFIVLEILDTPFNRLQHNPCIIYLQNQGYEVLTRGLRSVILRNIK